MLPAGILLFCIYVPRWRFMIKLRFPVFETSQSAGGSSGWHAPCGARILREPQTTSIMLLIKCLKRKVRVLVPDLAANAFLPWSLYVAKLFPPRFVRCLSFLAPILSCFLFLSLGSACA